MTGTSAAVASPVDFARYGEYTVKTRAAPDGAFVRPVYPFTGHVTADGSSGYQAEPGRYHLYVSTGLPVGAPQRHRAAADEPGGGGLALGGGPGP
jgi:hypothetical protein